VRIVNLLQANTQNVGDHWTAPARHAAALGLDGHVWKILDQTIAGAAFRFGDVVVIGGGGNLAPYFPWMKAFGELPEGKLSKVAVWGAGTNYHDVHRHARGRAPEVRRAGLTYPDWLKRLADGGAVIGVRDVGAPYQWVPCASALLPHFDRLRATRPTVPAVAYEHLERPLDVDLPKLSNAAQLEEALAHLASGEVVVTNTYHGAYWATLLGRRVVAAEAFSNRLRFMKHQPAFVESVANWASVDLTAYPLALEECRDANLEFAGVIKERFGL
jgi:hypothetical protein